MVDPFANFEDILDVPSGDSLLDSTLSSRPSGEATDLVPFVRTVLESLPSEHAGRLKDVFMQSKDKCFSIGTLCSGSDCVVDTIKAVFRVGQEWADVEKSEKNWPSSVAHRFSCENDPKLQEWILKTQSPDVLISEMSEIENTVVPNIKTALCCPRPPATSVYCGWVCHDASRRNPRRSLDCVSAGKGLTASTFKSFLAFLQSSQPRVFYGEMVAGNMDRASNGESNHDHCMSGFDTVGYKTFFRKVDPTHVGVPVTRSRIHYVGFLKTFCSADAGADMAEKFQDLWALIDGRLCGSRRWDLDDFLYGKFDDPVSDEIPSVQLLPAKVHHGLPVQAEPVPKKMKPAAKEVQWPEMHHRICQTHQVAPADMISALSKMENQDNPFWQCLSKREKDIVAFFDCVRPVGDMQKGKEEVLDLSQNLDRVVASQNVCTCITPSARLWLRARQRLLCPEERFKLHGMTLKADVPIASGQVSFLNKMAGNSWSYHNFIVGFITALSILPVPWFEPKA